MTAIVLIAPLKSIDDLPRLEKIINNKNDIIELRVDYLNDLSIENIQKIADKISNPCILTLRSQSQGGLFSNQPEKRIDVIKQLITLKPNYIDIEYDLDEALLSALKQQSPNTKIIRSYHDFNQTPDDLNKLLKTLQHPAVDIYKIVTQAKSSLDSLRMMNFIQLASKEIAISGHCMGEYGLFSRLAGPVINSYFLYAAINTDSVINNLITLDELESIYRAREKNTSTKLFSLIGDPVKHSVGHIFHNDFFEKEGINALYVKIALKKDQLDDFFNLIKPLPFFGLSITMPLKKEIAGSIKTNHHSAINTIKINKNNITATNTDGIGALQAIKESTSIANKNLLVLGSGGTSAAICYEFAKHCVTIFLANRSKNSASIIQENTAIEDITLFSEKPPSVQFDIVINTLPPNAYESSEIINWVSPILQKNPVVMDVNYNRPNNPFIDLCKKNQCSLITGEKMFYYQALAQQEFWFF